MPNKLPFYARVYEELIKCRPSYEDELCEKLFGEVTDDGKNKIKYAIIKIKSFGVKIKIRTNMFGRYILVADKQSCRSDALWFVTEHSKKEKDYTRFIYSEDPSKQGRPRKKDPRLV